MRARVPGTLVHSLWFSRVWASPKASWASWMKGWRTSATPIDEDVTFMTKLVVAYQVKACIHCTQVPETSFDLLFLEQITQLLCIEVPETFAVYGGL